MMGEPVPSVLGTFLSPVSPLPLVKCLKLLPDRISPFTISNDAQKIVDLTKSDLSGTDAKIVFNEMSANNGSDGKFKRIWQ